MPSFYFFPSCAQSPCFEVSFLYTMVLTLLWGKYLKQNTMGKESLPLSVPNSFYPSCLNKNCMESTPPCSAGKRNPPAPGSAGSWRVPGPCVVVHRILAFLLLSLYIGLRDYTVSLCEYGQLAFTNMYLSTFSCLKKEKKPEKNGVIEGQQRVGLRCLGGLSGHFDNMASPLACLIVMFNGHPCS